MNARMRDAVASSLSSPRTSAPSCACPWLMKSRARSAAVVSPSAAALSLALWIALRNAPQNTDTTVPDTKNIKAPTNAGPWKVNSPNGAVKK